MINPVLDDLVFEMNERMVLGLNKIIKEYQDTIRPVKTPLFDTERPLPSARLCIPHDPYPISLK